MKIEVNGHYINSNEISSMHFENGGSAHNCLAIHFKKGKSKYIYETSSMSSNLHNYYEIIKALIGQDKIPPEEFIKQNKEELIKEIRAIMKKYHANKWRLSNACSELRKQIIDMHCVVVEEVTLSRLMQVD